MYDRPELRAATDRLWAFLRDQLRVAGVVDVPEGLCRDRDHGSIWAADELFFSQACGFDVHLRFPDRLTPVGAPRYCAEGCEGHRYCSALVVRVDDAAVHITGLRGRVAAYNEPTSHSGRVALAAVVGEHARAGRFFGGLIETGSHEASAEAVADGRADIASLDCTSWALMRRARPQLDEALRILAFSPRCPAPPYVVGPGVDETTRRVVTEALARVGEEPSLRDLRVTLLLDGVTPITAKDYAACGELARRAERLGYDLLADEDAASPPVSGTAT